MRPLQRLLALLADLRLAIGLLLLIAITSGVGTAIPQKESGAFYHQRYDPAPWLGLLHGDGLLALQLDHVYSSGWFLALLAWLGLSLLLCSWRRQWPALQASLRWIDYQAPRQLSKLSVAETRTLAEPERALEALAELLRRGGWQVRPQPGRLAARRGLVGRVGPLLVHAGLVVLMVGASWGALAGQRLEQFLAPGRELELLDSRGSSQVTLRLDRFAIQRDPAGRPEQFTSALNLQPPAAPPLRAEISVNHPLRYRGMTLYQADWALAAIELQLGRSPVLPLPLQAFPQLGEQVWGLVLPTRPDGGEPVLLSLSSEQGPVEVFGPDGNSLGRIVPGGEPVEINGLPIRVLSVLPASGILLKRDPGVPLVYTGFAIALLGGGLSLVATRQLWAVAEAGAGRLHVAGLCNRNLTAFANELPALLAALERPVEGEDQQG
ncbi:MAG: cytochrome c biogenesis protein ResB [Synechococcaceae cyanobacterium]|nr:cytochrome c biogenesis protein ResB [Synechococcaceae cyanobacterium]